jgi:hypothetical protein
MGSIRVIGPYNPEQVSPQMMSNEMAERVAARRIAEQGINRNLNQSIRGAQDAHDRLDYYMRLNAPLEFKNS